MRSGPQDRERLHKGAWQHKLGSVSVSTVAFSLHHAAQQRVRRLQHLLVYEERLEDVDRLSGGRQLSGRQPSGGPSARSSVSSARIAV